MFGKNLRKLLLKRVNEKIYKVFNTQILSFLATEFLRAREQPFQTCKFDKLLLFHFILNRLLQLTAQE